MSNYQRMFAVDYTINNGADSVTVWIPNAYTSLQSNKDVGRLETIPVEDIFGEVGELERTLSQEDARLLAGRSFIEQMGGVREQKYSGQRRE